MNEYQLTRKTRDCNDHFSQTSAPATRVVLHSEELVTGLYGHLDRACANRCQARLTATALFDVSSTCQFPFSLALIASPWNAQSLGQRCNGIRNEFKSNGGAPGGRLGFSRSSAEHDDILGVALIWRLRIFRRHTPAQCVMQIQIGVQWADYSHITSSTSISRVPMSRSARMEQSGARAAQAKRPNVKLAPQSHGGPAVSASAIPGRTRH
jgi:hypothetical protein